MARGSAQNAKGNKANNQPASAKGAGSHLRANKGHEADFDDFEPLVEPSANRDIAGVVIAVLAIASFIAVISPATAPATERMLSGESSPKKSVAASSKMTIGST